MPKGCAYELCVDPELVEEVQLGMNQHLENVNSFLRFPKISEPGYLGSWNVEGEWEVEPVGQPAQALHTTTIIISHTNTVQ